MNRAEELTETLLDRGLGADEAAELAGLLSASDAGEATFVDTLRMEASLRGLRELPDQGPAVLEQIQQSRERRLANRVMQELHGRRPVARRRKTAVTVGLFTSAMALAAAAFWHRTTATPPKQAATETVLATAPRAPAPESRGLPLQGSRQARTAPAANQATKGITHADPGEADAVGTYEQDYEGGALVRGLIVGLVTTCPPRPGSSLCAQGALSEYTFRVWVVTQRLSLTWSSDLTIEFDYWVAEGSPINVLVHNATRHRNYSAKLAGVTTGAWTHVVIREPDLLPVLNPDSALAGDTIENITITGGRVPDGPLYIDDIRVTAAHAK